MLDTCSECGRPLRNGVDSKQYIEYPPDKLQEFTAGLLSITQLNEFAIIYYNRTRLCANEGNANVMIEKDGKEIPLNPPCSNFYGIRGGKIDSPDVIVETLKIKDG